MSLLKYEDSVIFDSHSSYCCLVWAQYCSTIQRIAISQKTLFALLIFNEGNATPIFSSNKAPS